MPTDDDTFAIRGRRRHSAIQIRGNNDDALFQSNRKDPANYELIFLIGRQIISAAESRRKMPVIFGVPVANLAPIVINEAVAAAIVVIVTVFMAMAAARISPMSPVTMIAIVMIAVPVIMVPAITVVVIMVSLGGKHNTT
jgi:hypothetical protein